MTSYPCIDFNDPEWEDLETFGIVGIKFLTDTLDKMEAAPSPYNIIVRQEVSDGTLILAQWQATCPGERYREAFIVGGPRWRARIIFNVAMERINRLIERMEHAHFNIVMERINRLTEDDLNWE